MITKHTTSPAETERSAKFVFRFGSKEAIERLLRVKSIESGAKQQERKPVQEVSVRTTRDIASPAGKPRQHEYGSSGRRSRSPSRSLELSDKVQPTTAAENNKTTVDAFLASLPGPVRHTEWTPELGPPAVPSMIPPRRANNEFSIAQYIGMRNEASPVTTPQLALVPFASPSSSSIVPNTPTMSSPGGMDPGKRAQLLAIERQQKKNALRRQIIPLEIEETKLQEQVEDARSAGLDRTALKKALRSVQLQREALELERSDIKLEETKEGLLKDASGAG